MKRIFWVDLLSLVSQVKDFHQHHIWCFPLPSIREKISLNAARTHHLQWSAVMSSHAAFIASNRHIWFCGLWSYTLHLYSQKMVVIVLWAICIYSICSQTWLVKWLNGWFKLYCNYRSFANLVDITMSMSDIYGIHMRVLGVERLQIFLSRLLCDESQVKVD